MKRNGIKWLAHGSGVRKMHFIKFLLLQVLNSPSTSLIRITPSQVLILTGACLLELHFVTHNTKALKFQGNVNV